MMHDPLGTPSPYEPYLNRCDECDRELHFAEVVDTDEGLAELWRCPCHHTEMLKDYVSNDDDLDDLFVVQ